MKRQQGSRTSEEKHGFGAALASAARRAWQAGRGNLLEALEPRQLLSATFTYDLRFAPGQEGESADGHSVDLSQPHADSYTLQLWGQITGDTNLSNDLFSCGFVSVASTQVNGYGALAGGGITDGEVDTALFPLMPSNGTAANITDDGVGDWGSSGTQNTTGWMFWANADQHANGMGYQDGTIVPGLSEPAASDPTNTWEVLIATFTVDVSTLAAPDSHYRSTEFNVAMSPNWMVEGNALAFRADGSIGSQMTGLIGEGVSFDLQSTAPAANSFSRSLWANTSLPFTPNDFSDVFSDGPVGNPLTAVVIETLPTNGNLLLGSAAVTAGEQIPFGQLGELAYEPDAGFAGADAFAWAGFDGMVLTQEDATVSLTVTADPPPQISSFPAYIDRTFPLSCGLTESNFANNFSDVVPGDALQSIIVESLPPDGVLTLDGQPVVAGEHIPASDLDGLAYEGPNPTRYPSVSRSFKWMAVDTSGAASNTASVNFLGGELAAWNVAVETAFETPVGFTESLFTSEYADFDYGEPLQGIVVLSLPAQGTLTLNDAPITSGELVTAAQISGMSYTPASGFAGDDSFSWAAFDGQAYGLMAGTVALTVDAAPSLATSPGATGTSGTGTQFASPTAPTDAPSLPQLSVAFGAATLGAPHVGGSAFAIGSPVIAPPIGAEGAVAIAASPAIVLPQAPVAPGLVLEGQPALRNVSSLTGCLSLQPQMAAKSEEMGAPPAVVVEIPFVAAPVAPLSNLTLNHVAQIITISSGETISPALGPLEEALAELAGRYGQPL